MRLQRAWLQRGPLAALLWPASLLFGLLGTLRRILYRRGLCAISRPTRPVVVIGNLLVGGAGKTPLVLNLIEALRQQGRTPGVISRGYGGSDSARGAVLPTPLPDDAARRFGDEATLIRQRSAVPMAIGARRALAAQRLLAVHPEVDLILCDDGLQHYALARDVEIAVFDGRGTGNGWLLPAGPLREPLSRLRSVDAIVLNGDRAPGLPDWAGPVFHMRVAGSMAYALGDASVTRPLTWFRDQAVLAVAGIGQPERFFDMLESAGLRIRRRPLPDHYRYQEDVFDGPAGELVLMTEKDAVKCAEVGNADCGRFWVVPVDATLDAGLTELILEKTRGRATA